MAIQISITNNEREFLINQLTMLKDKRTTVGIVDTTCRKILDKLTKPRDA